MKIVFFGTPEFAAIILEKLVKNNLKPVLVVTGQDKPVGRNKAMINSKVKAMAEKYGILTIQPASLDNSQFIKIFKNSAPDLGFVAAYGPPFLTKELLAIPQYGCLNVHASLLPDYRGASPIAHVILNGEPETGVTIIRMSEKIDQGDIVAQERIKIADKETAASLSKKLADLGADLAIKTILTLAKTGLQARAQNPSTTPYCFKLKKQDGWIDWKKPAEFIEKQTRAFDPWPGAFTHFKGKLLKILKTRVIYIKENQNNAPGFVFLTEDKNLAVATGKGALLIEELQLEGKKPLLAKDFLRGRQNIINTILK